MNTKGFTSDRILKAINVLLICSLLGISSCTSKSVTLPVLTTDNVTGITRISAVSGGNITDDGGGTIDSKGACWSTSANPTTADNVTDKGSGSGSFTADLTGLTPNTVYYVRAYATNSAGTNYGNQVSFPTPLTSVATLTTASASAITSTTAVSGGNITSDGGESVTLRGVCWGTTVNPTTANDTTLNGSGSGIFASHLINLTPNTTYYIRSYAVNSVGTAYGNQVSFKTAVAGPGANEVFIQGSAFNPVTISVAAGTTITWTNKDGVAHTVTSDTGAFDSGTIATNGTFSHTFSTAGTFAYHCAFHPGMTATVVVN